MKKILVGCVLVAFLGVSSASAFMLYNNDSEIVAVDKGDKDKGDKDKKSRKERKAEKKAKKNGSCGTASGEKKCCKSAETKVQ